MAAAPVRRAVGKRYGPILEDTGRLRKDEAIAAEGRHEMHDAGRELAVIDAGERFYSDLTGVAEPEAKRDFLGILLTERVEQAVEGMAWPRGQYALAGRGVPRRDRAHLLPQHLNGQAASQRGGPSRGDDEWPLGASAPASPGRGEGPERRHAPRL